jgi:hypothetical protein
VEIAKANENGLALGPPNVLNPMHGPIWLTLEDFKHGGNTENGPD